MSDDGRGNAQTGGKEPQLDPPQAGLWRVVAQSLIGDDLPASFHPADVHQAVSSLSALGWDAEALARLRDAARAAGGRWPAAWPEVALPGSPLPALSQLDAARQALLAELGLMGRPSGVRRGGRLDAEDRRLLADRPPHHGSVG